MYSSFKKFQHWDHLKPRLQMKFCPQCEVNSFIILDSGNKFNQGWSAMIYFFELQLHSRDLVTAWNTVFIDHWWCDTMWGGGRGGMTCDLKKIFYLFRTYIPITASSWVPLWICHLQKLVFSMIKQFSIGSQAEVLHCAINYNHVMNFNSNPS